MRGAVTPFTGVAIAALAVLAGVSVVALRAQTGVAGWDAIFGALTDTKFTNTLGMLWWGIVLVPGISTVTRAEVLIRHGSPARAVLSALAHAGITLGLGVVAVAIAASVAGLGGTETPWRADSAAAVFTSAALATSFPSPWLAAAASIAFTAASYAVVGLIALTLAVLVNARIGIGSLIAVYLWAALSSFGTFDTLPGADLSRLISLPWALHTGTLAPALVIATLTMGVCILSLWVGSSPGPVRFRRAITSRFSAIVFPTIAAALAFLMPAPESQTFAGFLGVFFAGSTGDIIQYAALMALVLGYTTTAAFRLFEHASERFTYEAIRLGSPARWTLRTAGTEIAIATGVGYGIVAGASGAHLIRTEQLPITADLALAWTYGLALAIQTVMYVTFAVALLWLCTSPAAWLALVGVSLALGYPLIADLGVMNIFASFSGQADPIAVSASAAAGAGALSASLLAGRARRTPAITI